MYNYIKKFIKPYHGQAKPNRWLRSSIRPREFHSIFKFFKLLFFSNPQDEYILYVVTIPMSR